MNVYKRTITKLISVCMAFAALCACNTITEELPLCSNYVKFTYTRNMKYVDAFPVEVKRVDLYIFDEQDRFVTHLNDAAEHFASDYRMELSLPAGKYHLIAWAGLEEQCYDFASQLIKGKSTPKDLCVKMKRKAIANALKSNGKQESFAITALQNEELPSLWHAETSIEITDYESHTTVMDLTKDTNRLRIIVQAEGLEEASKEALDFQITGKNGFLNYDNSLLPDEGIAYLPYFTEEVDLSGKAKGITAMAAEMNTMRLMENENMRLKISKKNGEEIIHIDLIKYLLLTKMNYHNMEAQEYLDRQDEYAIIFYLDSNYMIVKIKINEWIIRPQDTDF